VTTGDGAGATITAGAVDARLRARGGRATRQRRAIYAALAARHDHPTAETLHREIRRRHPDLSLATVYRTLDILVRAGLAIRLPDGAGVARFDARTDDHHHLRCLACGRVSDIEASRRPETFLSHSPESFTITGYHLELVGYCAGCGEPRTGEGDPS
jgi:Fe2+ or Zn2+ uptake regulation protein